MGTYSGDATGLKLVSQIGGLNGINSFAENSGPLGPHLCLSRLRLLPPLKMDNQEAFEQRVSPSVPQRRTWRAQEQQQPS